MTSTVDALMPARECANCAHDGRRTAARWQGRRIAVCDEHKGYHERLAVMTPLYDIGRFRPKSFPVFHPL